MRMSDDAEQSGAGGVVPIAAGDFVARKPQ